MITPWKFVARFLATFAALVVLSSATDGPARYGRSLQSAAEILGPATTGWWMVSRVGANGTELWLRRGDQEMAFRFSLEKFALGLLPLVSLITATPGLGVWRWLINVGVGGSAFFALDLLVVLAYPALVQPGVVADIAGTFLGLIAFVGGPVILWFALTFQHLRSVWKLDFPQSESDTSAR